MISLYIHIPFCASKCAYCSFNSIPISQWDNYEWLITNYIVSLKKEIDHYATNLEDRSLKTLYFWWGTPSRIGKERIIDIIEYVSARFDVTDLAELSIELNPYPETEVLDFVYTLNKKYSKISRLRYSFGIQSFDDEILKIVGRGYGFSAIADFLRTLVKLKQENNVFNFDFIAFWRFQVSKNGYKQLRHEFKRTFLQNFLDSGYVDSISLYTLEGIRNKEPGIRWKVLGTRDQGSGTNNQYYGTDDEIMEEFLILKEIIERAWFGRYEISNFAKAGKASIHNMIYRNMENYIWIWLSASWFINQKWLAENPKIFQHFDVSTFQPLGLRRTNTWDIKHYLEWHRIDEKEVQILNESDLLIEEFFLRLRTREGISDISKFASVLVPNHQWLLTNYQWSWLVISDWTDLRLTDEGMNVYNSIITDLLQKI